MYGSSAAETAAELERTAFRNAEKRYKLYKSPAPRSSRKKQSHIKETDLSDVFDFSAVLEQLERSGETPAGIFRFDCPGFHRPVFCFNDRPGFYFIPGALTTREQVHWIRESLATFPQPPNRTNHTAIYGPIFDLFNAVRNQKVLIKEQIATCTDSGLSSGENIEVPCRYLFSDPNSIPYKEEPCKSVAATLLLRKLRWSTLGLQFDWSKRNYDVNLPHNKIPDALALLAKKMALPAMPSGEEFQPEAAIVNYFGPSDMLGGHVDDMEADWSKPIVSISLGCTAIFLLGGKSRDDLPVAMFLRSGDIVLMAGQARECFHGIPRIFAEKDQVSALLSQFSDEDDAFRDYIATSRININIRQVN